MIYVYAVTRWGSLEKERQTGERVASFSVSISDFSSYIQHTIIIIFVELARCTFE